MKRMLANEKARNLQENQCCFQALEVLIHLKNNKKLKNHVCCLLDWQPWGKNFCNYYISSLVEWVALPRSLCIGGISLCAFAADAAGVVNACSSATPRLLLLLECATRLWRAAPLLVPRLPVPPAESAVNTGFSAEIFTCSNLQAVLCV